MSSIAEALLSPCIKASWTQAPRNQAWTRISEQGQIDYEGRLPAEQPALFVPGSLRAHVARCTAGMTSGAEPGRARFYSSNYHLAFLPGHHPSTCTDNP